MEVSIPHIADRLTAVSPAALRAKQRWAHDEPQLATSLEYGAGLLTKLWTSDEGKEGMAAFLAKRTPDFAKFR